MAEHALFVIGATITDLMGGAMPKMMVGVDVDWDSDLGAWRASWDGGSTYVGTPSDTKAAVVLAAFSRIVG